MAKVCAMVVGAGGVSAAWFPRLQEEKVEVVAVVDLRRSAAEEKIAQYNLKAIASDDLAKILRTTSADFLVDLTTPEAHCQVTCAALKASLHVVGEKPMASSMAEAKKMVATARKTGRLYMVSQSRRWEPHHDAMARTVAAGRLGPLTTVNCDYFMGAHFGGFRDEMPNVLILDMAIHHFDMARMISGKDPVRVYAEEFNPSGSWYKGAASANCIFEMTDGVRFAYRGSWCAEGCQTGWNGDWRVIGEKGTMIYISDQPPFGELVAGKTGFHRPQRPLKVVASPLKYRTQHGAIREMLRFLRTGPKPQTACEDNIKSLAMVFAAIESSRQGRRVPVQ